MAGSRPGSWARSPAKNRKRKGERIAREAEQAARRGIPRGSRRPFGYEPDRISVRDEEAALIREAVDRVLSGQTVAAIARDWNARQIPTPQRAAYGWSAATIAGQRAYLGEIVADDCWPAIVDRATFARVQAKITRGARPGRAPKAC
jgi:hypothetical protein